MYSTENSFNSTFIKYEGYFILKGSIGHEIRTTVRIRWSFAHVCCAMSLVCPSIATHRTSQFRAGNEPVNTPKTVESPAKCGVRAVIRFLLFRTSDEGKFVLRYCPFDDNAPPYISAATKWLLKRFRWEVFDQPPLSARTWLPVIIISFLVLNGRRRTKFWHAELQTSVKNWLKGQAAGFYLVLESWTTLRNMPMSERRLCREVVGRCG